jgi:hypothetical protein
MRATFVQDGGAVLALFDALVTAPTGSVHKHDALIRQLGGRQLMERNATAAEVYTVIAS